MATRCRCRGVGIRLFLRAVRRIPDRVGEISEQAGVRVQLPVTPPPRERGGGVTQDEAQLFPGSDHWRAVCGQSRLHGSGGGRRKRTRSTGTSPAAYLTLNVHKAADLRQWAAAREWLAIYYLPPYAPDLNPVEASGLSCHGDSSPTSPSVPPNTSASASDAAYASSSTAVTS